MVRRQRLERKAVLVNLEEVVSKSELMSDGGREPAIRLRNVRKSYIQGIPVLDDINLEIPRGKVIALAGANGSGKSTLVKILSGYHSPDKGSHIWINGIEIEGEVHPDSARSAGMRFVHQDTRLVSGLSVLDNMLVGAYRTGFAGRVKWRAERKSVQDLLDRWNIDVNLDVDPAHLPVSTIAKLGVLRALRTEEDEHIRALVLDEPTATLNETDARELLDWVHNLAVREHVGVLFVGHRLQEILTYADRVAVLRSGRIVLESSVAEGLNENKLVSAIVGSAIDSFYPVRKPVKSAERLLEVEHLAGLKVQDVSFTVNRGEIIGITGLAGGGFDDIPYLLVDPGTNATGDVRISETPVKLRKTTIAQRRELGLSLVPSDRHQRAIAVDLTLRENLVLPRIDEFARGGFIRRSGEHEESLKLLTKFGVRPPNPRLPGSSLSGGNQQKAVLAKWMSTNPEVLVIHEPTQGVDVGAKAEIFQHIANSVAAGLAVVFVSVEYEDLAHLCDRVYVIADGHVVSELMGKELTVESITAAALMGARVGT